MDSAHRFADMFIQLPMAKDGFGPLKVSFIRSVVNYDLFQDSDSIFHTVSRKSPFYDRRNLLSRLDERFI